MVADLSWLRPFQARLQRRLDAAVVRADQAVRHRVQRARVRQFRAIGHISESALLFPETHIENLRGAPDALCIGDHTAVRGELVVLRHGGAIEIGDWCYIGASTRLWSAARITLGHRVLVAHACEIHDWNAHPLDARARHRHFRDIITANHPAQLDDVPSAPVTIEHDAWIGFGSTLLKGVTIGHGSIVAARSLVTESVLPVSTWSGVD